MEVTTVGIIATVFFATALFQSLGARHFAALSEKFKEGKPMLSRLLHFFSEPEIIFGMWGAAFIFVYMFINGYSTGLEWVDRLNFSEVAFVFVIMILASTRPVTDLAELIIGKVASITPLPKSISYVLQYSCLGTFAGLIDYGACCVDNLGTSFEALGL